MEGKTLILSVLVMGLLMAQIQVDAAKSCCSTTTARNRYNTCRLTGTSQEVCASVCGCLLVSGGPCPSRYPKNILENTADAINEYCNLGCVFSVCDALTTLQNSDASEIVRGAVEKCSNACSAVCTKRSMNAVETA